MIRSIVLAAARTGSNLLLSLLNSHPDFHFHGELFHPARVNGFHAERILTEMIGVDPTELRDRDPVRFVETAFALSPTHHRAVGFKLFLNHDPAVLAAMLDDPKVRPILLDRPNRLASWSSILIGRATDRWWVAAGGGPPVTARVAFDPAAFDAYRTTADTRYARMRERLAARGGSFALDYADLQRPGVHRRLVRYLGGDATQALTPGIVRQNPPALLDRFTEPDAVRAHLDTIGRLDWLDPEEAQRAT